MRAQEPNSTPGRRLCCLQLIDPTVVVMGKEPVLLDGEVVGYVTSAGFGYSTGESLAYAYLPAGCAEEGTMVEVEYFGDRFPADGRQRAALGSRGRAPARLIRSGRGKQLNRHLPHFELHALRPEPGLRVALTAGRSAPPAFR